MNNNSSLQNDDLTPEEISLLNALRKMGSALPAELAVKTFSLPEEMDQALGKLKAKKLVDVRPVPGSYGELIMLSKTAIKIEADF
jgi:hypothetical protein